MVLSSSNPNPNEHDDITLTCHVTGGNPVNTYDWTFTPRYGNTGIQQLEGWDTNQLQLTNVIYSSAGEYVCSATNDGGVGSDEIEVLIRCK